MYPDSSDHNPCLKFNIGSWSQSLSSEVSSWSWNTNVGITISVYNPVSAQNGSRAFSKLSNSEPGTCWGTFSFCYPLLCKYPEDSVLKRYCFYSAWTYQIRLVPMNSPSHITWCLQTRWTFSMGLSFSSVSVGAQAISATKYKVYRQRREREVCCLSVNGSEWSCSVASKKGVGVVRDNYGIQSFSEAVHWPLYSFYGDWLHWYRSMRTKPWYAANVDKTAHSFSKAGLTCHLLDAFMSSIYRILYTWTDSIFTTYFTRHRRTQRQSNTSTTYVANNNKGIHSRNITLIMFTSHSTSWTRS